MKKKRILILITHSLGELDVIFPIFSKLYQKEDIDVELVFTVNDIYSKFESNDFYQFFVNKFKIKTSLRTVYKYKSLKYLSYVKKIISFIKNIVAFVNNIFKGIFLIKKIISHNYFMHEFTNQMTSTWILYLLVNTFSKSKKIIVYMHGHAIHFDSPPLKKTKYANKVKALVFHEHSIPYWNKRGFTDQHIIGYPKFFPEWINLVKDYSQKAEKKRNFVLIYTRDIHPYYMDKDKYIKLLLSSCKIINSKFKDVDIIIKPHPRESNDFIIKILNDSNINNFKLSNDYSLVFSDSCILAFSFWTSAILDALCSKTPAIEYYIEADKFREVESNGSLYKYIGIVSVDNKVDLEYYTSNLDEVQRKNETALENIIQISNTNFL